MPENISGNFMMNRLRFVGNEPDGDWNDEIQI